MTTERTPEPLLDAVLAIAEDLDLDGVLHRVVRACRSVVGARYAALGVLDDAGTSMARFLHDGMDDETAARIGPLPTGKGVLGEVIRRPRPLVLDRLADHPSSVGFPDNHPPMASFLGVPVVVGEEVFGNLYLTDKPGGFTDDDRRLAVALAAVAGAAIRNARDVEALGSQARIDAAVADVATTVLGGAGLPEGLDATRRVASVLADVPLDLVSIGRGPAGTPGTVMPVDEQLHVRVTNEGEIVALPSSAASAGRELSAFGRRVALALGYARARDTVEQLAVRMDRERIARDLHDTVIQRLFGAGLHLDGLTRRLGDGEPSQIIGTVIGELDAAIADLRATIAAMHDPGPASTTDRLRAVVAALQPLTTGLQPLSVVGDTDGIAGDVATDLVAVLREGITNAARHASANAIRPRLVVTSAQVQLTIEDDGVGLSPEDAPSDPTHSTPGRGLGLSNLSVRARRHGGSCLLEARADTSGARLVWAVPST